MLTCPTEGLSNPVDVVEDVLAVAIQTEEISEWKKKLEKFYVTEAAARLIEVVKNNQCTIITGVPGSGKSLHAYHVAIYIQETEGYTILPIWLPSELIKMANSNVKQLFVFDDVFGTFSLNESNLNCWESETRHINLLLKNKVLKVMVTCRSCLYDNVRDTLSSQSFEHFYMQSDEITLSLVERKNISKMYLTDDVVSHLNDETVMMYNFFPLLCVMFKDKKVENADFFQNPNQFIQNEIENFKSQKDVSFIALALLVLSNNSIEKEGLQIGLNKYDCILQDLFDVMDTRKSLNGAKVNQKDREGHTPLLHSCNNGYVKVIEILLKRQANVNICDIYGWSPLHMAGSDGNTDLIKLLINHKAKVNKRMNNGMTVLYMACNSGNFNAVQLLLEHKADVNK
ncbi:unnamed protein product [Mytilus coruscus]|uniref:Novel STAND NTPase 3 domain-containing protein n=1 Tax=Mytilus coruscus TaxID=42192 RepID=A0A6J7ZY42_MYTCO|nr:unnamed protein product [Mytilus coruscus]